MRIVNTDNFAGEYPNESFVNIPSLSKVNAGFIAQMINEECSGITASRYWKVVENNYKLPPTMEDDLRNN